MTARYQVVVVGGGLAGTAAARACAEQGLCVLLVERTALGGAASGNRQGILMPLLTAGPGLRDAFYQAGFQATWSKLQELDAGVWHPTGVLQIAPTPRRVRWRDRLLTRGLPAGLVRPLDGDAAAERLGFPVRQPALWYPSAGWVRPGALCQAYARHPGITVALAEVLRLEGPGPWQVITDSGECPIAAPVVIVATGTASFQPIRSLPVAPVRGQLTYVPAQDRPPISTVLSYDGHVLPAWDGIHTLGATFDRNDPGAVARPEDHRRNAARLQERFPEVASALRLPPPDQAAGRVCWRAASPDHLPMVGPLPGHPGLFVSLAHGSWGLSGTWLAAAILAARIQGGPMPVDPAIADALSPGRFA